MAQPARQSTAKSIMIGPVLDADGVAVTDGVVADFKISKNGAAPAALNGSATVTHRHTGFYSLTLTASDLDTVGSAQITIDDTVNTMPMADLVVLEEAIYDGFYANGAVAGPVNVVAIDGQLTSGNNATLNLKQLNIVNNAGSALVASSTGSNGHGMVLSGNGTGSGLRAQAGSGNGAVGLYAVSSAFNGTGLMCEATNATIGVAMNLLANTPTNGIALNVNGTTVGMNMAGADGPIVYGNVEFFDNFFLLGTGNVFADAVSGSVVREIALGTPGGTGGSPADIADAVWDELRADHVASGSFGEYTHADLTHVDGTANAAATLALKAITVVNDSGTAVLFQSTGANGNGLNAVGQGSGSGVRAVGGATGNGLSATAGGTSGNGVNVSATNGNGIAVECITGNGVNIVADTGTALFVHADVLGSGMVVRGIGTASHGLQLQAGTDGHALNLVGGSGSGEDLHFTTERVTLPAEETGPPSGLLQLIRRIYEGLHNKRIRNRSTGNYQIRNEADSADLVTATQSTTGTVDTQTADA